MKLAIITCNKLTKGTTEDQPLFKALKRHNIDFDLCIWNKANDWNNYDACLLRSVWDYHENIDQFNQWLKQTSTLTKIINPAQIISWNQNKKYLAELQEFGITIAPTEWLTTGCNINLKQFCHDSPYEAFFLKPVIGADSSGTIRFTDHPNDIAQAQKHLNQWLPQVDMMLQPYLKSVETFGETSAIYIDGQLTHSIRKIPQIGDYRVQDTYGATDIPYEANAAELSLSKACLDYITDKFELPMYARFDFLHDEHGSVFLNEAELIEPSLFFHHCPKAATKVVNALFAYLETSESNRFFGSPKPGPNSQASASMVSL